MASLFNVGRGLVKKPYDAEIEYLQNNSGGTAYIVTDVYLDMNDVVEGRTLKTKATTHSHSLWGCGDDYSTKMFHSYISNANSPYIKMGINQRQIGISRNANEEEIFYVSRQLIRVQNVTTGKVAQSGAMGSGEYSITRPFWIFASSVAYPNAPLPGLRFYWLKIHNKADFIPVRKGTTGYMFDKVSGRLFGNAGTGNFILGPDKN